MPYYLLSLSPVVSVRASAEPIDGALAVIEDEVAPELLAALHAGHPVRVVDGVVQLGPDVRPDAWSEWDWVTGQWIDPRPLEVIKAARWEAIKADREAAVAAPTITTPLGVFDADARSVSRMGEVIVGWTAAQAIGQAPETTTWTLADNTDVVLTLAELQGVAVAILARGQQAFAHARALRAQIDAASTPAAVAAVVW